jgi:hypothetical protein
MEEKDITIVSYSPQDGIMPFPDSFITNLYSRMVEDGTRDIVFYAGHIDSPEAFLRYMKRPDVWLYVFLVGDEVAGFTWLDGMEDRSCFNHFCVFKEFWGDTICLGKTVLNRLMNMNKDGVYAFDLFKGLVPAWNTHAIEFAIKCGGKKLGLLPKAVWNAEKQRSEDAVFIYYTRGGE